MGVMYSARTGLEHQVYSPRRVFVPWFHQLYTYPTLTQAAIYTESATGFLWRGPAAGACASLAGPSYWPPHNWSANQIKR